MVKNSAHNPKKTHFREKSGLILTIRLAECSEINRENA